MWSVGQAVGWSITNLPSQTVLPQFLTNSHELAHNKQIINKIIPYMSPEVQKQLKRVMFYTSTPDVGSNWWL